MRVLFLVFISVLLVSCSKKQNADKLFYNAVIYTFDSAFSTNEAMVVTDGKIVETGNFKELNKKYATKEQIDLKGKFVYPGFIDAHCHFYGLGNFMQMVDLSACKNFNEVVEACIKFYSRNPQPVIYGRGWDQNKWDNKDFPENTELNMAFPEIPVILKRVDGHAAIVNNAALKLAGFTTQTKIFGGDLLKQNNQLTGVLIDNAVDSLEKFLPKPTHQQLAQALILAQKHCFEYGITGVHDAGLEPEIIEVIDSLQKAGTLKMRIYAMVSISDDNITWLERKNGIKTNFLNVSSFKMYADGALGSRGACLLEPYNDSKNNYGLMITQIEKMESYINRIANTNFQLNTHCIGDSANRTILNLYGKYLKNKLNRRWRIEHAQVIHPNDFDLYGKYGIVPSVQPTHATSDMYWAEKRLGPNRIKSAYAYKDLLIQNGWLPLGTDFPVEHVSPFYTIDAAVSRKDEQGFPVGGFEIKNALTIKEALKGITIWAAMAAFEENEKGSLESGKFADFVILDIDLLKTDLLKIRNQKPIETYVGGNKVN
ncbi:MAG: amidohydrolase [Bacteroidia bacterium]